MNKSITLLFLLPACTFTRPTLDDVEGVDPDAVFNCELHAHSW